jgi:hypothetical protein
MRTRPFLLPLTFAVVVLTAALTCAVPSAGAAPDLRPLATAGGTFHAVTPARIVDTRNGIGVPAGAVPADGTIEFQVSGVGGIPPTGAGSVVLNLTAVDPTSEGYLNVYPRGLPKPTPANPSSLNFNAGQNVANAVTVTLSTDGGLTVYNAFGNTHVLVDVVGWYDLTGTGGGRYNPIAPSRIMDTRRALGPSPTALGPNAVADLDVTGVGGVPASGVSAVVVNLTATETTSQGFLTVYPQAGTRPDVSNLNFVAGTTRANLVTVGVNQSNGQISIYNAFGNTHVIVDVVGWYDVNGSQGYLYHGITPTRVADTRPFNDPLQEGVPAAVDLTGSADVPNNATGLVMNVTATDPSTGSFLTVYPNDIPTPDVSNSNWPGPGNTVPNLVIVRLPASGEVAFVNAFGTVHLLIDLFGYFDNSQPAT